MTYSERKDRKALLEIDEEVGQACSQNSSSQNDEDDEEEPEETLQQRLTKVEVECPQSSVTQGIDFSFYTRSMLPAG